MAIADAGFNQGPGIRSDSEKPPYFLPELTIWMTMKGLPPKNPDY
jgi:hypothetical protein